MSLAGVTSGGPEMLRGMTFGLALVALLATPARAQPILHEYVPPPGERAPPAGAMPSAIKVDDRTLPMPEARPGREGSERVIDGASGGTRRPDRLTPDRTTTHDGVLSYRAEFNPSVVPFKRMTALDAVGPGYTLGVRDGQLSRVRVANAVPSPDRDLFWGSLVLRLARGRPVPIPSVAPEARILSYNTTPKTDLRFYRDSADNFWVRARPGAAAHRGQLRLVFLTDAPRRYFTPSIPSSVTSADVPQDLRPALSPEIRKAAARVIRQVGVSPRATIFRQLERLTAYFRNFKPGPLPRLTGDTYLDIALSQTGVCRHRSFAFVITAQALGIPARYVQNEAHAFTEVFVPRMGWARVDLGGASSELQVLGAKDKAIHTPGFDPFPRPARYDTGYSRLNRGVTGVRPSQRLRAGEYRVALESYDRSSGSRPAESRGAPDPRAPRAAEEGEPTEMDLTDDEGEPPPEAPPKRPTQISVHTSARTVFRGERISIWGRVTARGDAAADLRVELYVSRDGKVSDALLGATVSGADGRFSVSLPVPMALKAGEYRIYAATPGGQHHEASISR
jgi:hypothetical protein